MTEYNPELDPQLQGAVAGNAQEFFAALDRFRQGQRMFDEKHDNVARLKASAVESFNNLFANTQTVHIRVSPFDFFVGETSVYNEGDPMTSLSYRFHQDGVKEFVFHHGITEEEFLKFVDVCSADFSDPKYQGYDTASLMWEYEFQNIAYVAVESFAGYEDSSDEDTLNNSNSGTRIVSSIDEFMSRILGDNEAGEKQKLDIRISSEDLELLKKENKLADVNTEETEEDASYELDMPASARQQLLEALARQSGQLDRRRLYILVELMQNTTDLETYDGFISRFRIALLDGIRAADFDLVSDVLGGSDKLVNEPLQRKLGSDLAASLCHEDAYALFQQVAASKNRTAAKQMAKLLATMPNEGLSEMISRFAALDDEKLRLNWVGWVVRHPKFDATDRPEMIHQFAPDFAKKLLVAVGEKANVRSMRNLVQFMSHEDAAVRIAALDATSKSNIPEAKIGRRKCLDDSNDQVRLRALRYVQHMRDSNAASWLKEKLDEEAFLTSNFDETAKYVIAYAVIEQENAIPYLEQLLTRQEGRLKIKKSDRFHGLAIQGLEVIVTKKSIKKLIEIAQSSRYSKAIRQTAEQAAHYVKDRIVRKGDST